MWVCQWVTLADRLRTNAIAISLINLAQEVDLPTSMCVAHSFNIIDV